MSTFAHTNKQYEKVGYHTKRGYSSSRCHFADEVRMLHVC